MQPTVTAIKTDSRLSASQCGTTLPSLFRSVLLLVQSRLAPASLCLLMLCFAVIAQPSRAQENSAYTLAIGDVISINVFDEPDLSFDRVLITDTGTIPFPFLGEVRATGATVTQIQQAIVSGLKPDYLVDPKVTVSIVEYRPFFLTGEVKAPGSIPYQPGLTLRQAITLAGGLTERASTSRITVIPGGGSGTSSRVGLDYEVKPGDTITIEQSFF